MVRSTDTEMVGQMEQIDRRALGVFALTGIVLIGLGEVFARYLGLVDAFGFFPMILRVAVYITGSTLLWAHLLKKKRDRISVLMECNLLMKRNRGFYDGLIRAYDSAVGLRDPYTGGHGRRVAGYTRIITKALGFLPDDRDRISQAALVHDIGKIGVPDSILGKRGPLTGEEYAVIKDHPGAGALLLEEIQPLRNLAPAVRHHHERFDGTGYPDGLSGESIPIEARVIAVADTLDAMTTTRVYREKGSFHDAIRELRRSSGTSFDPDIVAVLRDNVVLRKLYQRYEAYADNGESTGHGTAQTSPNEAGIERSTA